MDKYKDLDADKLRELLLERDTSVEKLSANNQALTDQLHGAREKVRGFETEAEKRKREAEEAEAARLAQENDIEGLKAQMQEKIDDADGRFYDLQARFEDRIISAELNTALEKAGVAPELREGARSLILNSASIDVDLGDGEKILVGEKPLTDYVSEWASSDAGKPYVPNGNGGGGAGGGSGNGPRPKAGTGDIGGSRDERRAALAERFSDLPLS